MKNDTVKQLVYGSLLTAMITVATMFLKVPTNLGYIHLGDGVIFLTAMLLGTPAWMAAGIGSGLADLLAGYGIYAPVTFVIKAAMALIVCLIMKKGEIMISIKLVAAFVIAELFMVAGYFIFECFVYGVPAAAGAILFNLIQGGAGVVIGTIFAPLSVQLKKVL